MQLLVQKYGGTSVATTDRIVHVARRIAAAHDGGFHVLVVVSAMGHSTDELLGLARQVHRDPPVRELDMLLTAGERISMSLLCMALHAQGHDAVSFTGSQSGIITDTHHADARILEVRATRLQQALDAGRIVIVAGFQGMSMEREITTLGRGGSDTTAVALAAALGAIRCEIYTDVEGVFTADPRLVPQAAQLSSVSYDEMMELAAQGARVLHPRCVEIARRFGVPVHVGSSFTHTKGTVIGAMEIETAVIRGIACDEEVGTLALSGIPTSRCAALLETLGAQGIATRVVVQTARGERSNLVCLLQRDDATRAVAALTPAVHAIAEAEMIHDLDVASISIVGQGIQSHPGTTARILSTLAHENVPIQLVSSSAIALTCVVPRADAQRAAQALHTKLGLDAPADA
ncbi:MAG TPA: aspartate kinase [Candidatus Krumholzibacteria bacterium]|nr:aspartate kinase [Candidatus Krumholzibacteria bacterium]